MVMHNGYYVTSHVFAETTHVVAAPCGSVCVVIQPTQLYISIKFYRNPFRGFGAPGEQNFVPIPIRM